MIAALKSEGVETSETIRVVDHDVKPGVSSNEGEGDARPELRERILAAEVLIFGGPIWLGQPSSLAKRVLERMDAFLGETNDRGRTPAYGKLAVAAIVGNEDGAHNVSAELFQALNDVGFTIPAATATYWKGEAMHMTDYRDLKATTEPMARAAARASRNAAHLARLLHGRACPGE